MFKHKSVLLNEAIESLNIKEDGLYVDCTLGGGGHSEEILKRLTTIINSNFVNIKTKLHELGVEKVDGVLYDLGVSSPQFDEESRGFSYRFDGPLDMRMNQHQSLSAYDVVNNYSYSDLVRILYKYGDEKFAKSIARHIEQERAKKPIQTTFELVEIVKQAIPARARRTGGHPAKRTFQAIRIEVNDELNVFEKSLNDALSMLNIGGRVSVITFQSLEDKIAKYTFNEITSMPEIPKNIAVIPDNMQPRFKKVTRKPITATEAELQENYRSHSAKLRVVERVKEDEKE